MVLIVLLLGFIVNLFMLLCNMKYIQILCIGKTAYITTKYFKGACHGN